MILAHQGGWDETAFVIVPLSIIAALLAVANRRANRFATARAKALGAQGFAAATSGRLQSVPIIRKW